MADEKSTKKVSATVTLIGALRYKVGRYDFKKGVPQVVSSKTAKLMRKMPTDLFSVSDNIPKKKKAKKTSDDKKSNSSSSSGTEKSSK